MKVVTLDESEKLPDLIRLCLAVYLLQVNAFCDCGLREDVMTAAHPNESETKSFHEVTQFTKRNVLKMPVQQAT
jgi:hypothetical protein